MQENLKRAFSDDACSATFGSFSPSCHTLGTDFSQGSSPLSPPKHNQGLREEKRMLFPDESKPQGQETTNLSYFQLEYRPREEGLDFPTRQDETMHFRPLPMRVFPRPTFPVNYNDQLPHLRLSMGYYRPPYPHESPAPQYNYHTHNFIN